MAKPQLLMETGALLRPGSDRGLGRYARAWIEGYKQCGVELLDVPYSNGIDLHLRLARANVHESIPYHSTMVSGLPIWKNRPWICSIQDTIPLDLSGYTQLGVKSRAHFRNARRANLIVANSGFTASRVEVKLGVSSEKIAVIPLPVADVFSDQKSNISRGDTVCALVDLRIADRRKRNHWLKPISSLLRRAGYSLEVTGRGLENVATLLPEAVAVDAATDKELAAFFRRSKAMIYTSAYEGQGMPPLEAMACGTPIIAFSNSAVTEMVGPSQVLLADPYPWQDQRLDAMIPHKCAEEVVAKAIDIFQNETYFLQLQKSALENVARFSPAIFRKSVEILVERMLT